MKKLIMKQCTNSEQTSKLIELGFEMPKNTQYVQRTKARNLHSPFIEFGEPEFEGSYSIGELIEILDGEVTLEIDNVGGVWMVSMSIFDFTGAELIDCLFDACVELKEKGMI